VFEVKMPRKAVPVSRIGRKRDRANWKRVRRGLHPRKQIRKVLKTRQRRKRTREKLGFSLKL
jgi:hypothetical protein